MTTSRYWLFSARVDLAVFGGSALVALALLGVGAALGILHSDSPEWTWIAAVLLIDVAHVWSTIFRIYLDREVLALRPLLYGLTPLLVFAGGVALYAQGPLVFWRVLAYMAVFHFVRQQYGWVRLYRARTGETDRLTGLHDAAVIYAATLFPLIYWHAHLPRRFWWFLPGDFAELPVALATFAEPLYWALMVSYAVRSGYGWLSGRGGNPGRDIVVVTTAVCWYLGIVLFDSDYAFTVTNVIIHGVPYLALIYWYGHGRMRAGHGGALRWFRHGPWVMLFLVWVLAFGEELIWDRAIWQERGWLFGGGVDVGTWQAWLVPLLAVPQATHYVLDGFIWRRGSNPELEVLTEPP